MRTIKSVDCDFDPNPVKPEMEDIGILASLDPVALEQACVDLVYAAPDGKAFTKYLFYMSWFDFFVNFFCSGL